MRVTVRELGWRTRTRAIVEGVSFDLAAGETLGLVGPNGSGKSTLLRLIAGLVPRGEGEVLLEDTPLSRLDRREIARRIAFVEQQAETSDALTARHVVELGRTPWLSAMRPFGEADTAIVEGALTQVGMMPLSDARWDTLSGGERQRIHIARALAQRPRLLLLDEPTNHLDIHHQLGLLRLVAALPVTVVVALHDLNQALGCDRVAVLEAGRLIACGPPCDVLTPERLATIFRVGARHVTDPIDDTPLFRFRCLED